MKKKILALVLSMIPLFSMLTVVANANEVLFTIDVNEQYTDISYVEETNALGEVINEETDKQAENQKTMYITVLSVLLVVAIVVLVVTLKRAERNED